MTRFNYFPHIFQNKIIKFNNILTLVLILTNLILIRNHFNANPNKSKNELSNNYGQEKANFKYENKLIKDYSILLKNALKVA